MADERTTKMAGHPVHRKEKSRAARLIPWIFGMLVAAGLLWLFTTIAGSPEDGPPLVVDTLQAPDLVAANSTATEPEVPAAEHVAAFMEFAHQTRAANVGPAHLYIGDGIQRLGSTLESIATRYGSNDAELAPRLERLFTYAKTIQRGPAATAQADTVRQAFELGIDIMSNLQHRSFPKAAPQIEALRRTAATLLPSTPLTDQMAIVEQYFRQAGDMLGSMVQPAG